MSSRSVRLGVISDTHGLLRPQVVDLLAGVDMIVHAGDVGGDPVLTGLSAIAPTMAVSGNVDDRHHPMLALERSIAVGGLLLHVSHGDELVRPKPEALLARYAGDILVYGHTHRALEYRQGGRIVLNPGSAGPKRFSLPATLMTIVVTGGDVEVQLHTM